MDTETLLKRKEETLAETERRWGDVFSVIRRMQEELHQLRKERLELDCKGKEDEEQIAKLQEQNTKLKGQIDSANSRIEELESESADEGLDEVEDLEWADCAKEQVKFLADVLKQLECGETQQAATAIHHKLMDFGYFTMEVRVGNG